MRTASSFPSFPGSFPAPALAFLLPFGRPRGFPENPFTKRECTGGRPYPVVASDAGLCACLFFRSVVSAEDPEVSQPPLPRRRSASVFSCFRPVGRSSSRIGSTFRHEAPRRTSMIDAGTPVREIVLPAPGGRRSGFRLGSFYQDPHPTTGGHRSRLARFYRQATATSTATSTATATAAANAAVL